MWGKNVNRVLSEDPSIILWTPGHLDTRGRPLAKVCRIVMYLTLGLSLACFANLVNVVSLLNTSFHPSRLSSVRCRFLF